MAGYKNLNVPIEEEFHRQLKILAATTGRTIADIVREALKETLEREALRQQETNN